MSATQVSVVIAIEYDAKFYTSSVVLHVIRIKVSNSLSWYQDDRGPIAGPETIASDVESVVFSARAGWSCHHARFLCRIITIHNNPENLKVPNKYKHTQIPMADVDTEDISQHFNRTYEIIEEARVEKTGDPNHRVVNRCVYGLTASGFV